MKHVTHKPRGKFGRTVQPQVDDIATDPDYQATILRLGVHGIGTINARDIDRVQYVTQVASAIRRRRSAQ